MPYIPQDRRPESRDNPVTAGELNYAISVRCAEYWRDHGPSYQAINDILAALQGAMVRATSNCDKNLPCTSELGKTIDGLLYFFILGGLPDDTRDSGQILDDAIGALDGATREFYRRVAEPYEDAKRQENGDVYDD